MPVTGRTEPLRLAPLTDEHADDGFRLSTEAGWNQTVADWRAMLRIGEGWGRFTAKGQLVASALVLPYGGRVGWIAMVLVAVRYRHQGLGTAMMAHALQRCEQLGLSAALDATPEGRRVYRPLGFTDLFPLQRLQTTRSRLRVVEVEGVSIREIGERDLERVIRLDAEVFGVPRDEVMRHCMAAQPKRALAAKRAGRLLGFVFARRGRQSLHIGPVSADKTEIAQALVSRAVNGAKGPVTIDVLDHQERFQAWLTSHGFLPVRPFMRMLRGIGELGQPARSFAITGPEFG